MGFLEDREKKLLENEKKQAKIANDSDKEIYAHKLNNGFGEKIKNELKNPPKPNCMLKFKLKWSRRFTEFKERINVLMQQ